MFLHVLTVKTMSHLQQMIIFSMIALHMYFHIACK